ncbi:hypothetical protein KKC45_02530 [Patescibacteria group bacterium]|nr:hypothetical protein [Patescibacteria group bacterium]
MDKENNKQISPIILFILGIILCLGGIAVKNRVGGGDGIEWIFYIAFIYCWYKALKISPLE